MKYEEINLKKVLIKFSTVFNSRVQKYNLLGIGALFIFELLLKDGVIEVTNREDLKLDFFLKFRHYRHL